VRHARRLGLIERDMARALNALGELRNSFAHLPVKHSITDDDEAKFLKALPDRLREEVPKYTVRGRNAIPPSTIGQQTRTGMAFLYTFLLVAPRSAP
jgi:hypothetical protein